ncbi:MAG: hypothetical protein HY976_04060 [Candidatus Kerfeldbacteria bacterium]|nr:hypothetical protein [Candidatus Kerfeldbacteria bacterium]
MFSRTKHGLILGFGILGTAMSGYLSYWTLFGPSCHAGPISWLSCGSRVVKLVGLPTCVYGLFMFLAIVILAGMVWPKTEPTRIHRILRIVAIVGVLFSAGLSVYEIWIIELQKLPACVYGFFLYVGILSVVLMGFRGSRSSTLPTQAV